LRVFFRYYYPSSKEKNSGYSSAYTIYFAPEVCFFWRSWRSSARKEGTESLRGERKKRPL